MTKLSKPVELETAFNRYTITELLGEGGAGRVYGGTDASGTQVAVKVLVHSTTDKRQRFKNEIGFLSRNQHANVVTVTDHGVADAGSIKGPFYVMSRFAGSLRGVIDRGLPVAKVMPLFSQVLDGVEAAHLLKVTHRDLKPENVLVSVGEDRAAVADFGVARFTEEQLLTLVQTSAAARLANFQYAAPEQRAAGRAVAQTADIYALGLMLNELFTGTVPHGTDYQLIASVSGEHAYLDSIVAAMIRQNPADRPTSIADVKTLIQRHHSEAVSLQKLNDLNKVVIPQGEVDDPLAHEPPRIIGAEWDGGTLRMKLDRPVHHNWVLALNNMGSYQSPLEAPPSAFRFNGVNVTVAVPEHIVQDAVDALKRWLPVATGLLKYNLEQEAIRARRERQTRLQNERAAEERRLAVNRSIRL